MSDEAPQAGLRETDRLSVEAYRRTITVYGDREFARMYFAKWGPDVPQRQLADFARRTLRDGAVLDAGCGPGHHTDYLRALGLAAVGIDLSHEALRLAKDHYPRATFVRCDMLHTPFPDSSFEGIWACASFVHLPESLHDFQFAEFRRLLRHQGILALTLTVGQAAHIDAFGRFFQASPDFEELRRRLEQFGFEVMDWERRVLRKTTEGGEQSAAWGTITVRLT